MVIYLINVGTFINIVQFRHSWLANVSSRLETHSSSTIVVVVSSVFTGDSSLFFFWSPQIPTHKNTHFYFGQTKHLPWF